MLTVCTASGLWSCRCSCSMLRTGWRCEGTDSRTHVMQVLDPARGKIESSPPSNGKHVLRPRVCNLWSDCHHEIIEPIWCKYQPNWHKFLQALPTPMKQNKTRPLNEYRYQERGKIETKLRDTKPTVKSTQEEQEHTYSASNTIEKHCHGMARGVCSTNEPKQHRCAPDTNLQSSWDPHWPRRPLWHL